MYEKEQLREYVEKFALNYLQLLVHPNPPSVLFGADKDTGLLQLIRCVLSAYRTPGSRLGPGNRTGWKLSAVQPAREESQAIRARTSRPRGCGKRGV